MALLLNTVSFIVTMDNYRWTWRKAINLWKSVWSPFDLLELPVGSFLGLTATEVLFSNCSIGGAMSEQTSAFALMVLAVALALPPLLSSFSFMSFYTVICGVYRPMKMVISFIVVRIKYGLLKVL